MRCAREGVLSLAAMLLATSSYVEAHQEAATQGVALAAAVDLDPRTGITCFAYTVANPRSNTGSIANLSVDISKRAGEGDASSEGIVDGPGASTGLSQAVLGGGNAVPMVAVGLTAPARWTASITMEGTAVWFPIDLGLGPGRELKGFQICSHGLPSPRNFVARPYVDVETLNLRPPNGSTEDFARYESDLRRVEDGLGTEGMTVGPAAPPAEFDATTFIRTMVRYKETAMAQGWIKNQGILISLDAKLAAAQNCLGRGDRRGAVNVLDALLSEVDAQAEKGLTSEAVAVLKFNTQYLLSKIR
jgi:hypothetical protein